MDAKVDEDAREGSTERRVAERRARRLEPRLRFGEPRLRFGLSVARRLDEPGRARVVAGELLGVLARPGELPERRLGLLDAGFRAAHGDRRTRPAEPEDHVARPHRRPLADRSLDDPPLGLRAERGAALRLDGGRHPNRGRAGRQRDRLDPNRGSRDLSRRRRLATSGEGGD